MDPGSDLGSQAASVGALADPTRRALYEYVVGRSAPVGREESASALDLPVHTAKFHLERLVEAGLLATEFRRLGGRSGPGAGRPSKLYRRADAQVTVSLPERRYDLVGHILARGVELTRDGRALDDAIHAAAAESGREIGGTATSDDLPAFTGVLAGQGFEPRVEDDTVLLANCPFDTLAQTHTALVCGLNQAFVQGVADGVGCPGATARLEPEPGWCCVKVRVSRGS
ncbi:transcriptional regulator [Nocardioides sp. Root1257]|uniref:helix-turn-helix transcriptional regulator n=1 Tax=unclassified Nocardioides TaxID=2615069 RepID=UPI0006FD7DA7|nr:MULTISPECIES: helix-turn-helix domain-containing protein [unclassified Nocardioides]KQW53415.1 transcriptional regulator [Nocardioides sp. Root1257]KRC56101.1 transcriptional regulator [Nocardioides sp. Root224]